MGLPTVGLFTFFSYVPRCLYPETYPEVSTMSSRPALPFPRPVGSNRSLCDPVNLLVSVRRLTVGEATALCGGRFFFKYLSLYCDFQYKVNNIHVLSLTVTPAMTGAFPSISLKTSASASSPVFSLYFFLASSPSASLNSSYVMLRADFFLKCRWKRSLSMGLTLVTVHKPHLKNCLRAEKRCI